jgi:SAM-dependent methyltransferase
VIERGNQIDPITKEFLAVRLKTKTSWQWPNLVVRPLLAWHVENLVACDPTYFVDMDSILLDRINSWFTPEYQQRLCRYVYQEDMNQPMFDMLPENQFGLIYVPMVLNYRPIELIARYLNEFYCLLRPGGCLLFTFNNCDTVSAARLFEKFSGSYVPSRLLKPIAQSIGYKIVYEFNDVRATSWLELQKPGQLHSNRAGQTLAMIKPKLGQPIDQAEPIVPNIPAQSDNTPNSIDLQTIDVYNEFNVLLSVCEMLKIPRDKLLVKGQPSIKKMRKLITENLHSDQFPTEKIIRLLEKRKSQ